MNRLQAAEKRYANLKYLWQQAEIEVADLKVTKNALETQVFSFQQQNAEMLKALEEIEILGRDIRSTLATSMGNIARQALAQVGE